MKKLGIFALALATLAMVGCKKDNEPTNVNSVTISETSLNLAIGATKQLKATTDPAGASVTWESSNSAIASVTPGGAVKAEAEGEATITAKAGDKSATCKVTVSADAAYDNFNVVGYGLFGEAEMIPGTDTTLTFSFGEATCQLGYITVLAWDGNAIYNKGWAGNGYIFMFEKTPVYWIMEGEYAGYYVGAGGFSCREQEDPNAVLAYNAQPGQIDPASYFNWVKLMYSDDEEADVDAAYEAMTEKTWGAMITTQYNDKRYLNYGLYDGHINRFVFLDEDEKAGVEAMWAADVDWANMNNDRLWGFLYDTLHYQQTYVEGQGGEIKFVEPYDYATVHRHFDANGLWEQSDEAEAPARMGKKQYTLGDPNKIYKDFKIEGGKLILIK